MSFILDALKKSELERQRQAIPGLVDAGFARPRARLPVWVLGIAALLAVNLLVLSVVLMRGWWAPRTPPPVPAIVAPPVAAASSNSQPAAGSVAPPVRPSDPAAAAGSDHFSPLDAAPQYAPEIPVAGNAMAGNSDAGSPGAGNPVSGAAPRHSGASPPAVAGGRAGHRRDPVLTDDDYKPKDEEVLPTINELSLSGGQALPDLHLDVHVFATKAADRFVYINMRKYHEGATLEEGPTVERIRRDGVILSYQGLRFLLPRQ
jgi:general secretion pathway protein B